MGAPTKNKPLLPDTLEASGYVVRPFGDKIPLEYQITPLGMAEVKSFHR
jgi:hypothetical protein